MINSAVAIVLFDKKHKILLQHRTNNANRNPGIWGFFGGRIKPGESPLKALYREIWEELRYLLKAPFLFEINTSGYHDKQNHYY